MADPFIGQITMFAGNFAPRGWAKCDGALLPISQNSALFSILGTNYGGDGRRTLGLPDMRGRTPIHAGSGPGLPRVRLGQKSGSPTHTLTTLEMPRHNHGGGLACTNGNATQDKPANNVLAKAESYTSARPDSRMSNSMISFDGGGRSFSIMQPYQAVHFIIATVGTYPSRS